MKKEIRVLCVVPAVVTVLMSLSPSLTFASPKPIDFSLHASASGFYSSVQYKYAAPRFGKLSLVANGKALGMFSVDDGDTVKDVGVHTNFLGTYSPSFRKNKKAFAVSAGYSAGNARFEAEGIYQKFDVEDEKYKTKENAYSFAASLRDETKAATAVNPQEKHYVSLSNKDVAVAALIANACYDLIPEDGYVSPSACVGAGLGFTKFLGITEQRWIYQAKVGLQYFISGKTVIFASAYVNKLEEKKFEGVRVKHHISHTTSVSEEQKKGQVPIKITEKIDYLLYPDADMSLFYYGVECGVRLIL